MRKFDIYKIIVYLALLILLAGEMAPTNVDAANNISRTVSDAQKKCMTLLKYIFMQKDM